MRRQLLPLLLIATLAIAGASVRAQNTSAAPPPRAAPTPAAAPAATGRVTLLQLLQMGGPLMYPLYLCSLIVVAFGVERAIGLRTRRILPSGIVNRIRSANFLPGSSVDPQRLLAELQMDQSPIAQVIKAGLKKSDRPIQELEKAIEDAGSREADLMRRHCRVLSITGSIAPLLGLLGTVFGMIQAFMTVAAREEALGRTELLAAGIYQALVTTAVGLCIAIPAMVLYHVFVEKVDRMVAQMDDIANELVEKITAAV